MRVKFPPTVATNAMIDHAKRFSASAKVATLGRASCTTCLKPSLELELRSDNLQETYRNVSEKLRRQQDECRDPSNRHGRPKRNAPNDHIPVYDHCQIVILSRKLTCSHHISFGKPVESTLATTTNVPVTTKIN